MVPHCCRVPSDQVIPNNLPRKSASFPPCISTSFEGSTVFPAVVMFVYIEDYNGRNMSSNKERTTRKSFLRNAIVYKCQILLLHNDQ